MKYMGSKRSMLRNGLGHAIDLELENGGRFFDLFTGSGAVARHVATRYHTEVVACDLQQYAVVLAESVIGRREAVSSSIFDDWFIRAKDHWEKSQGFQQASYLQKFVASDFSEKVVFDARSFCGEGAHGSVAQAYGGYYFSPLQALQIDALKTCLPPERLARTLALAALVEGASKCAAAPGHTAQPFQPTPTALPFLREAWRRDVQQLVSTSLVSLNCLLAKVEGNAFQADALEATSKLAEGDLAFIDPPYSAVHYSRFYHVLETICSSEIFEVTGQGRYPPPSYRPKSDFSLKGNAIGAFAKLLENVAVTGSRAIVTFPAGAASNNVSGDIVTEISEQFFYIEQKKVTGRFSTLGGNTVNRQARQSSDELILRLKPR